MYADDTNPTDTTRTTIGARTTVNEDNARQWLLANKLSLNVDETEYILIASIHKIPQLRNDQCINIGKRISSTLGGLRRARIFVAMDILIQMTNHS